MLLEIALLVMAYLFEFPAVIKAIIWIAIGVSACLLID